MNLGVAEGMLWTPGNGFTSVRERQAATAVEEYESDLVLGQRRDTRDWVVYHRHGPEGQPFPVFNLGPELPNPERIKELLYKSDVRRHGRKIVDDIMRHNAKLEEAARKRADEASEEMAEALVAGFVNQGFVPFPKSLPNKHPKNRQFAKKEK